MSELGVNKVVLVGRAGGNAELKFTAAGKPVASFSLAVNESFKTRDGEKNDQVEWFRCVCWNKLAEIVGVCHQYQVGFQNQQVARKHRLVESVM